MLWSKEETSIVNSLRIEQLSLQVKLGCSAEERANAQEVRVTVELRFNRLPAGATTDSLNDTICYAKISAALKKHCEEKEFQLVERLALDCLNILRPFATDQAHVGLMVHKVRPPIEGLLGGTVYRCGDFFV